MSEKNPWAFVVVFAVVVGEATLTVAPAIGAFVVASVTVPLMTPVVEAAFETPYCAKDRIIVAVRTALKNRAPRAKRKGRCISSLNWVDGEKPGPVLREPLKFPPKSQARTQRR